MARATNTEIIEKLKDMEERLPNGELKEIQEDLTPFGFITTGLETDSFVDSAGDTWTVVE